MNNDMSECREKIVYIDEKEILTAVVAAGNVRKFTTGDPRRTLTLSIIRGVPEDVDISGIYYVFERRAFAFVLSHPSFELVDKSALRLEICGHLEREQVAVVAAD